MHFFYLICFVLQLANIEKIVKRGDFINIKESTLTNFYWKEEMIHKPANLKQKCFFLIARTKDEFPKLL